MNFKSFASVSFFSGALVVGCASADSAEEDAATTDSALTTETIELGDGPTYSRRMKSWHEMQTSSNGTSTKVAWRQTEGTCGTLWVCPYPYVSSTDTYCERLPSGSSFDLAGPQRYLLDMRRVDGRDRPCPEPGIHLSDWRGVVTISRTTAPSNPPRPTPSSSGGTPTPTPTPTTPPVVPAPECPSGRAITVTQGTVLEHVNTSRDESFGCFSFDVTAANPGANSCNCGTQPPVLDFKLCKDDRCTQSLAASTGTATYSGNRDWQGKTLTYWNTQRGTPMSIVATSRTGAPVRMCLRNVHGC